MRVFFVGDFIAGHAGQHSQVFRIAQGFVAVQVGGGLLQHLVFRNIAAVQKGVRSDVADVNKFLSIGGKEKEGKGYALPPGLLAEQIVHVLQVAAQRRTQSRNEQKNERELEETPWRE